MSVAVTGPEERKRKYHEELAKMMYQKKLVVARNKS